MPNFDVSVTAVTVASANSEEAASKGTSRTLGEPLVMAWILQHQPVLRGEVDVMRGQNSETNGPRDGPMLEDVVTVSSCDFAAA